MGGTILMKFGRLMQNNKHADYADTVKIEREVEFQYDGH